MERLGARPRPSSAEGRAAWVPRPRRAPGVLASLPARGRAPPLSEEPPPGPDREKQPQETLARLAAQRKKGQRSSLVRAAAAGSDSGGRGPGVTARSGPSAHVREESPGHLRSAHCARAPGLCAPGARGAGAGAARARVAGGGGAGRGRARRLRPGREQGAGGGAGGGRCVPEPSWLARSLAGALLRSLPGRGIRAGLWPRPRT